MTVVGREQLDHPALGATPGAGLHTSIETIYTKIGNDNPGRWFTGSAVADSTTTTYEHNFGAAFSEYSIALYTGTHPNLTRVANPGAAGWTIAANGGFLKTKIDVTTPSSGGPHTYALVVAHTGATGSGTSVQNATAASEAELAAAISTLSIGGIILITDPFTISGTVTQNRDDLLIIGRRGYAKITFDGSGKIVWSGKRGGMRDCYLLPGTKATGNVLELTGDVNAFYQNVFEMDSADPVTAIYVTGSDNRIHHNDFRGVIGGSANGIDYAGGSGNIGTENVFES